jgi:hypothetical protein
VRRDGIDHTSQREKASVMCRYSARRERHVTEAELRKDIRPAETITRAKVA